MLAILSSEKVSSADPSEVLTQTCRRIAAAQALLDRASRMPEGPERDGRIRAASTTLEQCSRALRSIAWPQGAEVVCLACRGLGAQARADGWRYDGAGAGFPCPDCGAKASDHHKTGGGAR